MKSPSNPFRKPEQLNDVLAVRRARWLILLGLLLPGTPQLLAGNRKLGRLGIFAGILFWLALAGFGAFFVLNRALALALVTQPILLWVIAIWLFCHAALLLILGMNTLRLLEIPLLHRRHRFITFLGALASSFALVASLAYGGSVAVAQASLLGTVFDSGRLLSPVDGRYNVLLLGGDAGKGRLGLRPDSISVLSVSAETGRAVNIGVPRNLQRVPFAEGSPMRALYPNGFNCGDECLLNAIYKKVMDDHRDLYPDAVANGSNPGIEATREAVEGALGLDIQYYVLIDMAGFRKLVNALGGVTLDVKQRLPIGGQEDELGQPINVLGWIEPGRQHLDGRLALWYARARHGTSDYDRMQRQREVEEAILEQLDPATVLSRFHSLASAGKALIKTDIPSALLPTMVDLAGRARAIGLERMQLVPPAVDVVYPNFKEVRRMVRDGLTESETQGGLN